MVPSADERFADLHLHSTCSDGADSPTAVVERAASFGFAAIALTDHDTVDGVGEAQSAASRHGITCIAALEISAGRGGQEVHVLGYGVNPAHDELSATLARLKQERAGRSDAIVQRLRNAGININADRVRARGGGSIGRMHVAQELVELGQASTVQQAFDRFLKQRRPGFVAKPLRPVPDAIAIIRRAGGLAFLAHPGLGRGGGRLRDLLSLGFDGIEVFHSKHTQTQSETFLALANELGLLISGGSDCHGAAKGNAPEMGKVRLKYEYVERITSKLG